MKALTYDLPLGKLEVYNDKPEFECISLSQTHSSIIVDFDLRDLKTLRDFSQIEADGIKFSKSLAYTCKFAIKTADCLPILLLGEEECVFLHAGWKGLSDGILQNEEIKSITPYYCFIGPSIQEESFKVTDEFKQYFKQSKNFNDSQGQLTFSLQREAKDQLAETFPSAFASIEIEDCMQCTYKSSVLNSFRRNKTHKRNWNIFSI